MNKPYKFIMTWALGLLLCTACNEEDGFKAPNEDASTFDEISHITIGGEGAAEISAYDPSTQQLFVVNNADESKIDVIDFSDPAHMQVIQSISITAYGAGVNSVAVGGDYLAAAIEADEKTDKGKIVVFNLSDLSEAQVIEAGALPDMVTFSPNAKYILSANEGEPNDDYSIDPKGSVTIVTVSDFSSVTLDFTSFNDQEAALAAEGFRVSGPNADLAHDVEPEYIAVSQDSKTAYVALQENNGLAIIDLETKTVSDLKGLGLKDYAGSNVLVDPSNEDGKVEFRSVPENIYGVYMPDGMAAFVVNGVQYLITANEGDGREYISDDDEATCNTKGGDYDEDDGCIVYTDEQRIKKYDLNLAAFPDAANILLEENFGRWKAMWTEGDVDGDGLYESLYTYGARSFSIWDANGNLIADSGDEMERQVVMAGLYDDGRSDDKGVEPEGVVVGEVNGKTIAFVGLERVDAVAVYDVSNPAAPLFLSILPTGDAPEGLVFISAQDSPTGKSVLVVSCEDDGTIWAFSPDTIVE
ncbi:choice-of-anchor I family protein [Reichenbachiella ulvae]|uniref:Choice-of-anchor I family protein n=1 Tax=Reichenbachiella ulvae TaxID=2980104 RepID=A0ABT3CR19_9BACT|nr:choice-of-anchor I family protein [Reichenbachiella ulvae]MCV9386135.1 choice-of-anchor I family protein [Reichenbachiella ulvae]